MRVYVNVWLLLLGLHKCRGVILRNDDAAECFIRNALKELKDHVFVAHIAWQPDAATRMQGAVKHAIGHKFRSDIASSIF